MTEKKKLFNIDSARKTTTKQISDKQVASLRKIEPVALVLMVLIFAVYVALYFQTGAWQMLATGSLVIISGFIVIVSAKQRRQAGINKQANYGPLIALAVLLPATGLFLGGITVILAAGAFLLILGVSILSFPREKMKQVALLGVLGALLPFAFEWLNKFIPWSRYNALQTETLRIFMGGVIGIMMLVFFWQLVNLYQRTNTIRVRLLIVSILLALLPALAVAAGSVYVSFQSGQKQVFNHLESVVALKEVEVDTWTQNLQGLLNTAVAGKESKLQIESLLSAPVYVYAPRRHEGYNRLQSRLQEYVEIGRQFEEIFLLNRAGQVVLSTNPAQEGTQHAHRNYFKEGIKAPYVQPPYYVARLDKRMLPIAVPVTNSKGETIGVLVGLAVLDTLSEIMLERAGLGKTGETYLVDAGNVLLTESRFDPTIARVYSEGINNAAKERRNGFGIYDDYRGVPVVGVYHWLPQLQAALMSEQDKKEAFSVLSTTFFLDGAIIFVSLLLTLVGTVFFTKKITDPMINLAKTAEEIAGGDLNREAVIERDDEVGDLALAFNSMTSQLRHLIANLEQRIVARTKRLEIVAALSERLTAILDFDQLLLELVNQVKDNFGYYHTHVYIIDEESQTLIMAAGAGEAGRKMKEQGHAIPLNAPASLVAHAARNREIVRADNVREDPEWLPNPLLPDTYSEMAVPIYVDGKVVGVLDVQESEIASLDEGDANLLRSLANQVAVAIRNAQLFKQVESELAEIRVLQQQYVAQAWDRNRVRRRGVGRVQFSAETSIGVNETLISRSRQHAIAQNGLTIVSLADEQGAADGAGDASSPSSPAPHIPEGDVTIGFAEDKETERQGNKKIETGNPTSETRAVLVSPIKLRNTTIGDLQIHGFEPDRQWTEGELAFIETIIDQVAQSAESIRLFEETQERANRERLVGEVSNKMRRAPNMEALMKITVDQLAKVLGTGRTFVRLGSSEQLKKIDGQAGEQ